MDYRQFGKTDLLVSELGFGAWAIGGPTKVGDIAIGWGKTNDNDSIKAIQTALDQGINFFDTADFYGVGHSEEILGKTLSNHKDVIIATKVGQRKSNQNTIFTDYSPEHIVRACEESLKRLKRETIDFYQLHTAKCKDLEDGSVQSVMHRLTEEGKIRYWGISLNTFDPFSEADFFMQNNIGHGVQIVLNLINQIAVPLLKDLESKGYGVIARMPLHFGLLSGKFNRDSVFPQDDHRSFRLNPDLIQEVNRILAGVWNQTGKKQISKLSLALSYVLSFSSVSTVIAGMRTSEQVVQNSSGISRLPENILDSIEAINSSDMDSIMQLLLTAG